jgi:hypothetical protein
MVQWRIVPGTVVLRGLYVVNGGWYAQIVDNKVYVDENLHGSHARLPGGELAGGGLVLDFWPEDCERLEFYYQATRYKDNSWNDVYQFAQYLYEADKAKAKFAEKEEEYDDEIPF